MSMTFSNPMRESVNAARSTKILAAFLCGPRRSHAEKSGKSAEESAVSTEHAIATAKTRLPRMTVRYGMGKASATSPAARMPARIYVPQAKMHAAARAQDRTGVRISRPASIRAGAENATFMPAYSAASHAPFVNAKKGGAPVPVKNMSATRKGTSAVFSAPTPFSPRHKKIKTTERPKADGKGA